MSDRDLESSSLKMQITLMLQQAQEVIVVKSLRDGKKNSTTAKLSWMCADFCETLENMIQDSQSLSSSEAKRLKIAIVMKMEFYQAIGYYCLGLVAEENGEYGEAVGYFR